MLPLDSASAIKCNAVCVRVCMRMYAFYVSGIGGQKIASGEAPNRSPCNAASFRWCGFSPTT